MTNRILLGVDGDVSLATQNVLHAADEFVGLSSSRLSLILINVIPRLYVTSPSLGTLYVRQILPLPITIKQRTQAENALWRARTELQKRGIAPERIEVLIRIGTPVDEIVKAARELQVDLIVIGRRENSLKQRIRRLFTGSTSQQILHLASCPVMIASFPQFQ